jgi:hypothetical protein
MSQTLYWTYVVPHLAHQCTLNQIPAVFCGFRVYAIWDRKWTVFWAVFLLYVAHAALFLVRLLLSSFKRLILILAKTPNLLSDFVPAGPPVYGCMMASKMVDAKEIMQ